MNTKSPVQKTQTDKVSETLTEKGENTSNAFCSFSHKIHYPI